MTILAPVELEVLGEKTSWEKLQAKHEAWLIEMSMRGWRWGPVVNMEKKEHPQLMPFDEFMASLRNKK